MVNIQLYIRTKIGTDADGNTTLAADDTATPVNLLLYSMFSQVDISLNGTLISNSIHSEQYWK